MTWIGPLLRLLSGSARDLTPIVLVIALFQLLVLRQPLPDLGNVLIGLVLENDIAEYNCGDIKSSKDASTTSAAKSNPCGRSCCPGAAAPNTQWRRATIQ